MITHLLFVVGLTVSALACQPVVSKVNEAQPVAPQDDVVRARAETLCQRLPQMKTMPFKGEPIEDEIYNGLMTMREAAVPCLIGKITDSTKMEDPRQTPVYRNFRVGDAAFFVLLDITEVPFEEMLPAKVRSELDDQGVYAYFEYINKDDNRKSLQARWRAWSDQASNKRYTP